MAQQLLLSFPILIGLLASPQDQSLSLAYILRKNTEALGGAENIGKIHSVKTTAWIIDARSQVAGQYRTFLKRPNFVRLESETSGFVTISAYDGSTAWTVNPLTGRSEPQRIANPADTGLCITVESAIGSLESLAASGKTLSLVGTEMVGKVKTYKVQVTANSDSSTYFLNAETFLPLKRISNSRTGQLDVEEFILDYKNIAAVMFPRLVEQRRRNRLVGQMVYRDIEVNATIDDAMFKMPSNR